MSYHPFFICFLFYKIAVAKLALIIGIDLSFVRNSFHCVKFGAIRFPLERHGAFEFGKHHFFVNVIFYILTDNLQKFFGREPNSFSEFDLKTFLLKM